VIVAILVLAVFAPLIAPTIRWRRTSALGARPPATGHPFGTDKLGRDVFARISYGAAHLAADRFRRGRPWP